MSFPWRGFGLILDCLGGGRLMLPLSVVTGDMLKHNLWEMLAHNLLLRGGGMFSHGLAGGMR